MAKNDNLKDFLTDVADAIREKKGTTDLINPQDFSAEIASIQSGGGAVAVSAKAVNFRDYDGTILHSYTKDEFLALTELPPLPTREGLICQEWNWNFADAVEYVSEYGVLEVGATYITDDGKTRLYISVQKGRQDVPLYFMQSIANGVDINWGDGGVSETFSTSGNISASHHYVKEGDYIITLEVAEGCNLGLGHATSGYCVMGSTEVFYRVYCNTLQKVEIGQNVNKIDQYAFYACYSLESITLPKGVRFIETYGFYFCYSLKSASLPKGMSSISKGSFYGCCTLDAVMLPDGLAVGESAFRSCSSLRTITLPKSMLQIVAYTFDSCSSLKSIVIPKEVTVINGDAFASCITLAYVIMPSNLLTILSRSFYTCYGVAIYDFSTSQSVPTLNNANAFTSISSKCKIIVPDTLYDTWIAATNWSTYASKIIKKSEWDALNA